MDVTLDRRLAIIAAKREKQANSDVANIFVGPSKAADMRSYSTMPRFDVTDFSALSKQEKAKVRRLSALNRVALQRQQGIKTERPGEIARVG